MPAKPSKLEAQELISVVTEPTRWSILNSLKTDKSARQIADDLGLKQALVQYHLKCLLKAGLVYEFPMSDSFQKRYLYQRKVIVATIKMDDQGTHADAKITNPA